jgi:hypothetical protein
MIGRLVLKARQFASTPGDVFWHRDVLRPRILKTPPVTGTIDTSAEIHVLTSARDWLNTVWSLKSFYTNVPQRYALVIHGDASLPEAAVYVFTQQFPDARIVIEPDARAAVLSTLSVYPRCKAFRETNTLSMKVFDFAHYLSSDRMILFDSDLLFFAPPEAFLAYLPEQSRRVNVFNPDVGTAYAIPVEHIEAAGYSVARDVNSGFGLIHKESLNLDWIEEFLAIPGLSEGHFWRIEQTLFALLSTRFGIELLPEDYRVFLSGEVGARPYRHYVGAVRERMYTEGMHKLKERLLSPTSLLATNARA